MTVHRHEEPHRNVERFLGLSLGGAKSDKTSLTVIDYYRKQNKAFVVDVYHALGPEEEASSDSVLLEVIHELIKDAPIQVMAVDAPLTLPPCAGGCVKGCPGPQKCKRSVVRWMNLQYRKAKQKLSKLKHFTPYSQRPVDLFFRYKFQGYDLLPDETLGANQAPLAARMQYLKSHLPSKIELIEVWPKLTLFAVQKPLELPKNTSMQYRSLTEGQQLRYDILESIEEHSSLFIYERDAKKIVDHISAFDSFLCAWVAMRYATAGCVKYKGDMPIESGWIQIPDL